MPELKETRVGKYLLVYPSDMQVKTYDEPWYHGIIFYVGNNSYEVIHNYAMDTERIFLSSKGQFPLLMNFYLLTQDIPFKPATFSFLPEGVTAKEV